MTPTFKTHLELEVRSPGGGKTGFPGFGNRFDDQIPVVNNATGFRPLPYNIAVENMRKDQYM